MTTFSRLSTWLNPPLLRTFIQLAASFENVQMRFKYKNVQTSLLKMMRSPHQ